MNLKAFFVDALQSALELGIGKPDDVVRHVTPDVLSQHLPRPLWARLLTACLGAPRVDAQLVVETIGVPNLCEHIPASIIWACIADIGARSIGKPSDDVVPLVAAKSTPSGRVPLAPPPPEAAAPAAPGRASSSSPVPGPAIPAPAKEQSREPLADLISELEADTPAPPRPRTATSQRFRQSATGINRPLGTAGARRPQAVATPARPVARRGGTEADQETETAVENGQWAGREIAVDDSQLVDWQADSGDDDFRKR